MAVFSLPPIVLVAMARRLADTRGLRFPPDHAAERTLELNLTRDAWIV
jgi:hypothetical protein